MRATSGYVTLSSAPPERHNDSLSLRQHAAVTPVIVGLALGVAWLGRTAGPPIALPADAIGRTPGLHAIAVAVGWLLVGSWRALLQKRLPSSRSWSSLIGAIMVLYNVARTQVEWLPLVGVSMLLLMCGAQLLGRWADAREAARLAKLAPEQ